MAVVLWNGVTQMVEWFDVPVGVGISTQIIMLYLWFYNPVVSPPSATGHYLIPSALTCRDHSVLIIANLHFPRFNNLQQTLLLYSDNFVYALLNRVLDLNDSSLI